MTTEYDFAISPHHLRELFHQPFGTSVASWFETALKRLLTMRVESDWRATTSDLPFSPCGRRWREAPDEGFSPPETDSVCGDRPLIRLAAASRQRSTFSHKGRR